MTFSCCFKPALFFLVFMLLGQTSVLSQAGFPQALDFNSRAAVIRGILVSNDTIACAGLAYKDNDSISNQQGVVFALLDSCGNLLNYHKYFDDNGKDMFFTGRIKIAKLHDAGYCFGGDASDVKIFIIKTNNLGNMVFYKKYSPPSSNDFYYTINSIMEIEGNLYAFGMIQHNNYDINVFLMKTNAQGDVIFFKEYGISEECESPVSLYREDNKIIVGAFRSNILNGNDFAPARNWIFEVDTSGNMGWEKLDSLPTKFWGISGLQRTKDGGWIYGSSHLDSLNPWGPSHYFRCLIVKLDSNFNQQWTTLLGNSTSNTNGFVDIVQTNDNGYIAGGNYTTGQSFYNPPPYQKGGLIVKLSSAGDTIWSNFTTVYVDSLGRSSNDLVGLEQLSSGTLIAGGGLYDFAAQKHEGWVTKVFASGVTDTDGGSTCEEVSIYDVSNKALERINVYPNPFSNEIVLEKIPEKGGVFRLWSFWGTLQVEIYLTGNQYSINTNNLSHGMYWWDFIRSDGKRISGKMQKI